MADARNSVGVKRRRLFGPQDDKRLEQIIREEVFSGWKSVAKSMPGFTAKQLRDRWHNYISPKNSLEPWSLEEDRIIVQKVKEFGTKWSQISSYLQGRSDNCIKNRWNTVLKEDCENNPSKYFGSSPMISEEPPASSSTSGEDSSTKDKDSPPINQVMLDERFIERFFHTSSGKSK